MISSQALHREGVNYFVSRICTASAVLDPVLLGRNRPASTSWLRSGLCGVFLKSADFEGMDNMVYRDVLASFNAICFLMQRITYAIPTFDYCIP